MLTRILFYGFVITATLIGAYRILVHAPKVGESRVVTSIPPLYMLARDIMSGEGAPYLLIKNRVSPHDFQLKPSDAAAFYGAKVVFWIGKDLEHGLKSPLKSLPEKVRVVEMLTQKGIKHHKLNMHEAHTHHDHSHEGMVDPHIWLDPDNAIRMAQIIRDELIRVMPKRKGLYTRNTARLIQKIRQASEKVRGLLKDSQQKEFAVFHDGYQYFQKYFGLRPFRALTLNPEQSLKIKRLAEVRAAIEANHIACLFTEPQFSRKVVEGLRTETAVDVAVLDPLGSAGISYVELLERMGQTIAKCQKK